MFKGPFFPVTVYIRSSDSLPILLNPFLNLTFSLLPITSSHSYASASDATCDYWHNINILLTLTSGDSLLGISLGLISQQNSAHCELITTK